MDTNDYTFDFVMDVSNSDYSNNLHAPFFSSFEDIPEPFDGIRDMQTGNVALPGLGITIDPNNKELQRRLSQEKFVIKKMKIKGSKADYRIFYRNKKLTTITTSEIKHVHNNTFPYTINDLNLLLNASVTLFIEIPKAKSPSEPTEILITFFCERIN